MTKYSLLTVSYGRINIKMKSLKNISLRLFILMYFLDYKLYFKDTIKLRPADAIPDEYVL